MTPENRGRSRSFRVIPERHKTEVVLVPSAFGGEGDTGTSNVLPSRGQTRNDLRGTTSSREQAERTQQREFSGRDLKAPSLIAATRRIAALEKALERAESKGERNVRGGSSDAARGMWCTPKPLADAVGPFDLDPFSNPQSHVNATVRCMLEDGGDGFGDGSVGSYRQGAIHGRADAGNTVWLQPPYAKGFVQRAFDHYRHTRWTALFRFDPRPPWWHAVYNASELVAVIAVEFEPPPGVKDLGGNSFPHALYYRRAEDVTEAVLRIASAVWRKKAR